MQKSVTSFRFDEHGQAGIALPLYIAAAGILAAVVGTLFVRTHEKASQSDLLKVQTLLVLELSGKGPRFEMKRTETKFDAIASAVVCVGVIYMTHLLWFNHK